MVFKREDVVYTYTDAQAVKDGVLVNVAGAAPFPVNRATRAVWDHFTSPIGKMPVGFGGSPVTDISRFSSLAEEVEKRIKAGDLKDGWVIMQFEGRDIWAMPNETTYSHIRQVSGWTIMFPEDY